uniref:Retrotransposon gag domain-containing protein n=1 Tax=Plectus sambesii TaxID=2011161 RepID=A0A914WP04_9BILA
MPVSSSQLPKFEGREEDFPIWQKQFRSAMFLSKVTDMAEKRAMLLTSLSISVYRTLISRCHQRDVETEMEYDELMMTLEQHYLTKPIQSAEYHRLFSLQQQSGQSANDFASQIGQVTRRCGFPIDLPRAQAIVFAMGYRDDKVRSELIQRDHMSMETAL